MTGSAPNRLFSLPAPDPDPVVAADPVGEVLATSAGRWGVATASYDDSFEYRFRLSRVWDPDEARRACWVMLNPSTATEEVTDPTVERTLRFSKGWGCGAVEVVNIFALRSTDPRGLYDHPAPVGEGNDAAILAAAKAADVVVAGWGTHGRLHGRGDHVRRLLASAGVELSVLRLTKDGHPNHPLYLPSSSTPQPWPPSPETASTPA